MHVDVLGSVPGIVTENGGAVDSRGSTEKCSCTATENGVVVDACGSIGESSGYFFSENVCAVDTNGSTRECSGYC